MNNITEITEADWAVKVEAATSPVLVAFGAAWCGACRQLDPILQELSVESGLWRIYKIYHVNADTQRSLLNKFKVRALPTVLIYQEGNVTHRSEGVQRKSVYEESLQRIKGLHSRI